MAISQKGKDIEHLILDLGGKPDPMQYLTIKMFVH